MVPKCSHPIFWFWGCLLFWFRLFSSCCWDGESGILDCNSMQCHVGVDGMGMGVYVDGTQIGDGILLSYFVLRNTFRSYFQGLVLVVEFCLFTVN